jgi:hypothetical protein
MIHTRKPAAVLLAALLVLSACSPSQTITNLQIALDAISAALPILAGITGVPLPLVTTVETYLTATNSALGQASTIEAGPGTDAEKAVQIAAAFAGIAKPLVPGEFSIIAGLVQTIAGGVESYLASIPGASAPAAGGLTASSLPAGHITKWSKKDYQALAKATATANTNAAKALQLWPKIPAIKSASCHPIATGYSCTVTFTGPTLAGDVVTLVMAAGMPRTYRLEAGVLQAQFAVQLMTASPEEKAVMVSYHQQRTAIN